MNRDMPARATDAEGVLATLLGAIADASTDEDTRALLQDAADALQVAIAVGVAERQRYRALFDAVPDPVSVIAWDGTVLDLNRAGIAAYRRERGEIIGQPIHVLNPELPRLNDDISRLVAVANSYDRAAPDLVGALNDFTVTSRTLVDEQDQLSQVFQTVTTATTDLTRFLSDNRDTIIALSADSRPTLALLAEYAPEFPCVLQQLSDFVPDVDKALGKGTSEHGLHVTLRVTESRGAYRPGTDTPKYDATGGPRCYPTPYAPTLVSPAAATAPAGTAAVSSTPAAGSIANTPQENEYINELLAAYPAQLHLSDHDEGGNPHVHYARENQPPVEWLGRTCAAGLAHIAAASPLAGIGRCAAVGCGNFFVDQSRNRTRRYCGNTCASRTTVAAHRSRARDV